MNAGNKKHTQHAPSTKTECDYLNGWIKKRSHTQKSHPKVVNPRDIAGERKKKKKNLSLIIIITLSFLSSQRVRFSLSSMSSKCFLDSSWLGRVLHQGTPFRLRSCSSFSLPREDGRDMKQLPFRYSLRSTVRLPMSSGRRVSCRFWT